MSGTLSSVLLFVLAVLPAIILCIFIYKKDRVEKEPFGLLATLFVLGIVIIIPAMILEQILGPAIINFFANFGVTDVDGGISLSYFGYILYQLSDNIIGIALVEEGLKWLVLYFVTRKNKNFNSLFDGLIYSVFVSLGFALWENIGYVFGCETFSQGLQVALARFVMSVPGHMFFSVFMGYCYSMWHVYEIAQLCEEKFVGNGLIAMKGEHLDGRNWLILSIVVPTLVHGIYDFLCSDAVPFFSVYIFVVALYIVGFTYVSKLSKADSSDTGYAMGITVSKYPELKEIFAAIEAARAQQEADLAQAKAEYAADAAAEAAQTATTVPLSAADGYAVPVSATVPITPRNVINGELFPAEQRKFVVTIDGQNVTDQQ